MPKIRSATVTRDAAGVLRLFDGWDVTQPADSAAAAYFNVFWKNLLQDSFDTELPADYRADGGDRWFTVVRNLWDSPGDLWWDDACTSDRVETRDDAVAAARTAAVDELSGLQGSDPAGWRWGALHTLACATSPWAPAGSRRSSASSTGVRSRPRAATPS